jgi:hypothetical protein
MQSWLAADSLRSVCDKGNNWITNRINKFRAVKSGYKRIRPKMLPKGLSTFKKEHCKKFDDINVNANFLKCRPNAHGVKNVNDAKVKDRFCDSVNGLFLVTIMKTFIYWNHSIAETEVNNKAANHEALRSPNIELKVITKKRRKSQQDSKIIVKSMDDQSIKILPAVLMTFNEKFINLGESEAETIKNKRIYVFRDRSDSMNSIDI